MQPRSTSTTPSPPLKMRWGKFVAILLYMGISELPSIDDYWAMETRVPQVENIMSSKRFRLMRRLVHVIDNTQISGTIDRFKSGHCSTSWLLSSGVSHRPPSSLWMKLWLPTKARQLAIWGNTSRASWRNVDLSCLPGLLMMALFMIWCYTRAKLCWRPTVSPWCLNNKPWVSPAT